MTDDASERFDRHIQTKRAVAQAASKELTGVVTINWLATVFRMDRKAVITRLTPCPPLKIKSADGRDGRLYDLATAARYLVPPAMDTEDFVKVLNRNELPAGLQTQFWDAMLKRQSWEKNAGMLWPTDRVMEVLGTLFQTIKFTLQLWVDTMEREVEVTPAQRAILTRMVDALMKEIYETLADRARGEGNGPQLADLPALLDPHKDKRPPKDVAPEEDEDDGSDLI